MFPWRYFALLAHRDGEQGRPVKGAEEIALQSIPTHDLRLPDGRALRYMGPWGIVPNCHRFEAKGPLRVLVSLDETPHGRLIHVSISYPQKNPLWTEIRAVRDLFIPPTEDAMMVLPREGNYVNLHEHTFHVWQTPTEWMVG